MNRVRNAKLTKSLCLKLQQVLTSMIHRTADTAIFPASVLQASQFIELSTDLVRRPTFLRERQIPSHIGTTLHKLGLEILDSSRHLFIDCTAHAGGAKEDGITEQTDGDVDIANTAEEAVPAERIEGLARVPEDEEYKYDVADSLWQFRALAMMIVVSREMGIAFLLLTGQD